ncbi:hypothetical protein [Rossellomorea aquimaris]|uniref:Uncharacterized protein n=1 Tax=Rossellomorea aquimaris TaxID=189382 RepID=A0A5D4TV07_9BACI|nr:hypothetical protein [Rossellomorea aquimaris]TYS78084.1 hypothetical protein FZC80_12660 [Rossellomorea aquimaris]
MENDKDKIQQDPNFDSLDDRLIASRPSSPSLVIKTNLDQQNSEESNPYYQEGNQQDREKFQNFFKE